ncbi:hypothetical protein TWF696_000600 [Orbilia brochopaga]|uniref:Uncharacterized protein n=1 Tax=Orbilia brochopaga TaxID=3140254 RepID=A0AAV9VE63_9PEZI
MTTAIVSASSRMYHRALSRSNSICTRHRRWDPIRQGTQSLSRRLSTHCHASPRPRVFANRDLYYYPPAPSQHLAFAGSLSRDLHPASQSTLIARHFSRSQPRYEMSDEDYAAFLQKANKDYSGLSTNAGSSSGEYISSTAHKAIRALGERFYSSDADEPFIDVTLDWTGDQLPDEAEFQKLIKNSGEVAERVTPQQWDSSESYGDVVAAVKEAAGGKSEVTVYRVEQDDVRKIYYILALDSDHKQLVGLKVLSVES